MTLKDALNSPKVSRDEVSLFEALIDYFRTNCASVVLDKTHKHTVSYNAVSPYQAWGKVDKEISDVFFLVFSRQREMARMTHLQAKWRMDVFDKTIKPQFKFQLDAGQYHMLSNRLSITDPQKVYPWNILSYPLYSDSIASYGVFYPNAANEIEMAFEIASMLSSASRNPFKDIDDKPQYQFATLETNYGYVNKYLIALEQQVQDQYYDWICRYYCPYHHQASYELLSTLDTGTFESKLLDLHVGTRVDFNIEHLKGLATYLNTQKDTNGITQNFLAFVRDAAQRVIPISEEWENNVIKLIDNYPPDYRPDDKNQGGGTLVLLDADETLIRRQEIIN